MDDINQPITGICIITKANNVPTGYTCIRKGRMIYLMRVNSFENVFFLVFDEPTRDADLMPDSFLDRKVRFLCITRASPPAGFKSFTLEDIKLINERDQPPPQYTPVNQTWDTHERSTTKRIICIKLVERQAGLKCICDIIFLARSKRPPPYYTLLGEINNLQMCIKESTVPSVSASATSNLYPNPQSMLDHSEHVPVTHTTKKSDEKEILDGIPFEINPKYLLTQRDRTNDLAGFNSVHILSPIELEQIFSYDFHLENSLVDFSK